ncbi:MAG: hypothetical protein GWM87_10830 [Xanthomonadales bacterium]|nr:phosphoenolpyruvate carboxylase [Xanthomonadales bacterium]NIX13377.1 hypothetical protein [Xanthomonadales bacterium]
MLALTLHVLDEALTGFLPFYNELVLDLRRSLGFFPAPVFTFGSWLGGLIVVLAAGFLLTPVVASGGRATRMVCIALGLLMIGNGLGHLAGSLYAGYLLPGVTSAPLVLAAACYLSWLAWKDGKTG